MTVQDIMLELKAKGNDGIKKILLRHGVQEPFFGVKVEDLKGIQKRIKKDYQLSKDLYSTGNADAMYLAGLIADEKQMTKADLTNWVNKATSDNISAYTVPWIAAESNYGYELALEWIDSKVENNAVAGWSTLSSLVAIKPDTELDIEALQALLKRVETTIQQSANKVKSAMNLFVISVGSYVVDLTEKAVTTAHKMGGVKVIREGTSCKVPSAVDYIAKVKAKGTLGKKKKMARC
jgi:3-methyladenine DNA glycosylase AlkD